MSSTLRFFSCHHPTLLSHRRGIREFYTTNIPIISKCFYLRKKLKRFQFSVDHLRLCSVNADHNAGLSDSHNSFVDHEGSGEKSENHQGESLTSKEILKKLRRYGISGILSYGLLNTAYYLSTFLLVWFYVAPAPGRMGYVAAVERFLKLMAMVWAGSQVTKLVRAGGALALAPFVDRGLSWFTLKFKFASQGKAIELSWLYHQLGKQGSSQVGIIDTDSAVSGGEIGICLATAHRMQLGFITNSTDKGRANC